MFRQERWTSSAPGSGQPRVAPVGVSLQVPGQWSGYWIFHARVASGHSLGCCQGEDTLPFAILVLGAIVLATILC